MSRVSRLPRRLGLAFCLIAAPLSAGAQSQADRTGQGRAVAGQELAEYPGFAFPALVAAGGVAAVLGAYLLVTQSKDEGTGSTAGTGLITSTTTSTR